MVALARPPYPPLPFICPIPRLPRSAILTHPSGGSADQVVIAENARSRKIRPHHRFDERCRWQPGDLDARPCRTSVSAMHSILSQPISRQRHRSCAHSRRLQRQHRERFPNHRVEPRYHRLFVNTGDVFQTPPDDVGACPNLHPVTGPRGFSSRLHPVHDDRRIKFPTRKIGRSQFHHSRPVYRRLDKVNIVTRGRAQDQAASNHRPVLRGFHRPFHTFVISQDRPKLPRRHRRAHGTCRCEKRESDHGQWKVVDPCQSQRINPLRPEMHKTLAVSSPEPAAYPGPPIEH